MFLTDFLIFFVIAEEVRIMAGELAPLVARLETAVERLERYQPTNTPACLLSPPPPEGKSFFI